ncbi:MAG TPA: NAD(P)(+) transhydrogenase (Re/Si-specific) subunit alpha, partial [Candidatus Xenobia bacterium]
MKIAVPKEVAPGETRVALTPESVGKLKKVGHTISVQSGAGLTSNLLDKAYEDAGATIVTEVDKLYAEANCVLKVQRPMENPSLGKNELDVIQTGTLLIGFLQPLTNHQLMRALAEKKITAFAMESVPRITRAQSMDALSSMSTVAGYKAVLLAANLQAKFFPMFTTAAGTIKPAKVLIIGAGVAGLQAIATARRLGAVVEAFDTRPVVKEQVQSLGASFVELEVDHANAQDAGGYAKELSADH